MKRRLMLTVLLASLSASWACAQGTINLAYDVCRVSSTGGKDDFAWPNNPCLEPANAGQVATLVPSFKNSSDIANFQGTTTVFDIFVGNGSGLPDFWQFSPGECHEANLSAASMIGGSGGIAAPLNCQNPYGPGSQISDWGGYSEPAEGRIHWGSDHYRLQPASVLHPPVQPGGYVSEVLTLSWQDAAADGSGCAGCDVPACILLSRVDVTNGFQSVISITQPELRQVVTFYGGTASCLGAVPTRNSSWGKIKALYR